MIVKICGIKTVDDGLAAMEAGADMLGFNFYRPSSRYIVPENCAQIVTKLRQSGSKVVHVGVFVNESLERVAAIIEECDLDLVQLCGDESQKTLNALGRLALKAVRPKSLADGDNLIQTYARDIAPALLVDAHIKDAYGGTGEIGDWSIAHHMARKVPILLAGGLNPENVGAAIAAVNPWGVDVASGVESSPGIKDSAKISTFITAAKAAQTKRYPNV